MLCDCCQLLHGLLASAARAGSIIATPTLQRDGIGVPVPVVRAWPPTLLTQERGMRFLSLGFLCTSVLGLFAPLRLPAQGSAVGGVVVTRASGAPIGDAQVSVSGTTVRAVTDASGRFRIPDVPGTTAVLEVRRIGFRAVQDTVRAGDLNVRIARSEEHTSELQSRPHLVCRLLLEKKKKKIAHARISLRCLMLYSV